MVGGALDEALRKSIADGESDEPRKRLHEQWSLRQQVLIPSPEAARRGLVHQLQGD